jgi:hypothetical protein
MVLGGPGLIRCKYCDLLLTPALEASEHTKECRRLEI